MLNSARAILAARMATWTATPICWPNTQPLTSSNAPWVRFAVIGRGDITETIHATAPGAEAGYVAVQCFSPAGSGDGVISGHADAIADLFRGYASGKLACGTKVEKRTVGESDGWYQINVIIPWTITE